MRLVVLAALLAPAATVLTADVAQARIGHNGRGQRVSYQPAAPSHHVGGASRTATPTATVSPGGCTASPCLSYFLGPVMRTATLTPVYWRPPSAPSYPTGYTTTISNFFTDLAADSGLTTNFYSTLTQYYDTVAGGTHPVTYAVAAGAPVTDTDSYPAAAASRCTSPYGATRPCVTDVGVQNELSSYLAAHNLPTGLGHEYVVYLPPGVDSCFDSAGTECSGTYYCGYHSYLPGSGTEYANEPDNSDPALGSSCGAGWVSNVPAMTTLNTTSHELSESITDPELNAWYDPVTGNENGDNCAWSFAQGDAAGSLTGDVSPGQTNNTIHGDAYILQAEWDNSAATCSLMAQPTASFTDSAAPAANSGSPVSFDATASTTPAGRTITAYQWNFGDGSVSSGATPTHAFTLPQGILSQAYNVTLRITDSAGQQSSFSSQVSVVPPDESPVAAFAAPAGSIAGVAVSFDGSASSDPDGSISSYSWSFGDGGTATGPAPSHTFSAAGTYSVTLTVIDSAGMSAQVAEPVVVAAPPIAPTGAGGSSGAGSGSLVQSPPTPGAGGVTQGYLPAPVSRAPTSLVTPKPVTGTAKRRAHKPKKKRKKKRRRHRAAHRTTRAPRR